MPKKFRKITTNFLFKVYYLVSHFLIKRIAYCCYFLEKIDPNKASFTVFSYSPLEMIESVRSSSIYIQYKSRCPLFFLCLVLLSIFVCLAYFSTFNHRRNRRLNRRSATELQFYSKPWWTKGYCLIWYRAGAWHYRIFPDFLNSGFKISSKTEGKARVIACSWNDIKGQITIAKNILPSSVV